MQLMTENCQESATINSRGASEYHAINLRESKILDLKVERLHKSVDDDDNYDSPAVAVGI